MNSHIRNFVVIAHIDHGKSTLADRFLEITHTVPDRRMKEQYLDQLELERERGITIKMAPVRMIYEINHTEIRNSNIEIRNNIKVQNSKSFGFRASDLEFSNSKQEFVLNLIDTPGHSDFSYEVSRALEAVEGAILLVDITQGIQAQTLANFYAAKKSGLKIIGAINKIDLSSLFSFEKMASELAELIGCNENEIYAVSGKTGEGVIELLNAIVEKVPPPSPAVMSFGGQITRALIFDSFYDNHMGVVASVRVVNGDFERAGDIYLIGTDTRSKIKEVGFFVPELKSGNLIKEGEIGYIATGIKDPGKIKIGDTVVANKHKLSTNLTNNISDLVLPGYKEPKPVVFVSFYPEESGEYDLLRQSLEKLRLNDSSLTIEPDQNNVLGRGFKIGCLGRLHLEITAERLKREFNIGIINTFPSVLYRIKVKNGWVYIVKPEELPGDYLEIWEPMIEMSIIFPRSYLSQVLSVRQRFRLSDVESDMLGERMKISARMPLVELVSDFDDYLKSVTEGFASFSYELADYEKADVLRVDLLVSNEEIPGLSRFIPRESFECEARKMVLKLKELLPRRQFTQPVQARADGRIIARADIPALRKNVTGYLYGGDRTRKMKLWKKQQRGKKRLKERAEATIPPEVFKELLKKE